MSNPLRWFRKYEKLMLGVFGVALMVVFTFSMGVSGLSLTDFLGGGGRGNGGENPVVATWQEGDLRESDFDQLRVGRNLMIQFTQYALQQARANGGQPRTSTVPVDNSDDALLELAILSDKADKLGVEIADEGVLNYLVQMTDGRLQPVEFSNIWQNMTNGAMSDKQLLSLMRREIMAIRVRGMMQSGSFPASPLRNWEYYNRMERRLTAEVMPISVEQFTANVPDPAETELKKFYEKYKNIYSYPESPEPGFKQRQRASFDYIKFSLDDFFAAEVATISAEQVAAYYESHLEEFRDQSFLEDDLRIDSSMEVPPAIENPPASDSGEEPKNSVDVTNEAGEEGNDSDDEPASTPSPQPQTTDSSDGDAGDNAEGDAGDNSEGDADLDEPTTQPPTNPTEPETSTTSDGNAAGLGKSDDTPVMDTPAEVAADAGFTGEAESDLEVEVEEAEKKYKSIEKVTEEIKRILARPIAQEKFDKAVAIVRSRTERFYREYVYFEIQREKDSNAKPPTTPDLSGVESPVALSVESVPLCDEIQIANYELGQAYDISVDANGVNQVMFSEIAFNENLVLNKAREFPTGDMVATKYLFWKTAGIEALVPEFEEIREQVVAAWKKNKAAELAVADAQAKAEEARASNKSLAETIGGDGEFLNTGEVTWLSGGNIPMDMSTQPRLSDIPVFEAPGDEVYRTLFTLDVGEIGVALNQPKDTVYVMRATGQTPDLGIRQEGFLENAMLLPGLYLRATC